MGNEQSFFRVIEETGYLAYTIRGTSMRPLLREGKDVVLIEKPKEHWKKYDTVLFMRKNGQYVLHRIIKILDGKCWIMGDNCLSGEMVNDNQIIGIMTFVKRDGKTISITDLRYRLYVYLWCAPYRIRVFLIKSKYLAYKCYMFMKRKVFGK